MSRTLRAHVPVQTTVSADEIFGFHAQQAAEKLFKSWIALLGEVYPLTHNIERLFNLLADQGFAVEPFRKLIDYTPYALEFRLYRCGLKYRSNRSRG